LSLSLIICVMLSDVNLRYRTGPDDGQEVAETTRFVGSKNQSENFPRPGAELSMGWVDPWVGLGWVGSTTAKVLKI